MTGDAYPSATAAARAIASGETSAERLAHAFLDRIAEREPDVQAFEQLDPAAVLAEARLRDRTAARSPIHGVPFAVKDVFDTADLPTAYGSRIYAGFRPRADAAAVALARAAGAVLLGKTVTTEFAGTAPGKTRNPRNPAHTPGGSSSGSAAAVAAGMAPLALGTQTAGSVIRPAAYCGIVGYRPSFGRIDRTGVKTLSQTCDAVGLFAGCVEDAALFAAVLAGRPPASVAADAGRLRIGIYPGAFAGEAGPETLDALARAGAAAERSGASVADVATWLREAPLFAAHWAILGWDVPRALAYERLVHGDLLQPKTRALLDSPSPSPDELDAAHAAAAAGRAALGELFGDRHAILTPAAPGPAPAGLGSTGEATFNRVWSLLGVPCVTVPVAWSDGGLPIGVQVVARPGEDDVCLAVAALVERTGGLGDRGP